MPDASSFPQDLLQHAAFLRRLARSLLADPNAAEDAAQETLRRTLERSSLHGDSRTWLARVLRNFVHRGRRTSERRSAREREVARTEALPSATVALERTELLARVVDAVRALEEPYRATIFARYYEDLSPSAIAEREHIPLETVHTRLRRGLAKLRERLARDEHDWRGALGLMVGSGPGRDWPCLPPYGHEEESLTLATWKAAAVPLALIGVAVALWQWAESSETERAPTVTPASTTSTKSPAAASFPSQRAPAETVQHSELRLSGRVRDPNEQPLAGLHVLVLGHHDPFGAGAPGNSIGWNDLRGRAFATDADGRWSALLPERLEIEGTCAECHQEPEEELRRKHKVLVTLDSTTAFEALDPERWVDAPAENVDFHARRR
jgi:RNA polymerase sigma-70 factor (ECF subfamily)